MQLFLLVCGWVQIFLFCKSRFLQSPPLFSKSEQVGRSTIIFLYLSWSLHAKKTPSPNKLHDVEVALALLLTTKIIVLIGILVENQLNQGLEAWKKTSHFWCT